MDPNSQNLDVWQMQEQLSAQTQEDADNRIQQVSAGYGNYESSLTTARASYGDVPAMMMAGSRYAGSAMSGVYQGAGRMLSDIGSRVRPATYMPPARVSTGQYGQYQQETGFFRGLTGMMGLNTAPSGANAYQYGYYNAADFGERMGGLGVTAASFGGGMAASFPTAKLGGMLGSALGAPFGPAGAMVGGGIGMLAGSMVGFMGFDAIGESIAQRRQIDAFLGSSSFRYVGSSSSMYDQRIGGMNAASRRGVTDAMRQMDIKDPTMDTEDLSKIMQESTRLGMFSGVNDIDSFKKKYKDIVDGIKSVTRVLGTSLEEGLQVMKDLKAINIDPSAMRQTVMQADTIGRVTGRTGQEVIGLGLQGAELFRGTGIEMKIGYQANVMNLSALRSARDSGALSQEAIVQAGGEEALAQRMTASSLGFMQSSVGRGYGAAFLNSGISGTGFDKQAFMQAAKGGGMTMFQLAEKGSQNLNTADKIMKYQANQEKYMSELGKTFGGMGGQLGIMNTAMSIADMYADAGVDKKTGFRVGLQELGQSESQIDTILAMIQNSGKSFQAQVDAANVTRNQQTIGEVMETRGLGYLLRRGEDAIKGFIEPVVSGGAGFIGRAQQGAINVWEKQGLGVERTTTRDADYGAFRGIAVPGNRDLSADEVFKLEYGKSISQNVRETIGFAKDPKTIAEIENRIRKGIAADKDLMGKYTAYTGQSLTNMDEGVSPLAKGIMTLGSGFLAGSTVTAGALAFVAGTAPISVPLIAGATIAGAVAATGAAWITGNTFSFTPSVGQQIKENESQLNAFGLGGTRQKPRSDVIAGKETIIIDPGLGMDVTVVDTDKLNTSTSKQGISLMTAAEAKQMETEGRIGKVNTDQRLRMMSATDTNFGPATLESVVKRYFDGSKTVEGLEATDYGELINVAEDLAGRKIPGAQEVLDDARRSAQIMQSGRQSVKTKNVINAQAQLDVIGGQLTAGMPGKLKGKLGRGATLKITQAYSLERQSGETDKEYATRKQALVLDAFSEQLNDKSSGALAVGADSWGDFRDLSTNIMNDPGSQKLLGGAIVAAKTVQANIDASGFDSLTDMVRQQVMSDKNLKKEDIDAVNASLTQLGGVGGLSYFLKMSDKDPLFEKFSGGAVLKQAKDVSGKLQELGSDKELAKLTNPKDRTNYVFRNLESTGMEKESLNRITNEYIKSGDAVMAQSLAFNEAKGSLGNKDWVSAAGTAGKGTGTEQGTAGQIADVQLNMFKDLQTALEGVARRLGQ